MDVFSYNQIERRLGYHEDGEELEEEDNEVENEEEEKESNNKKVKKPHDKVKKIRHMKGNYNKREKKRAQPKDENDLCDC